MAVAVESAGAGLVANPAWEHVQYSNDLADPGWEEGHAARFASARIRGAKVCKAEVWADGAKACRAEVWAHAARAWDAEV